MANKNENQEQTQEQASASANAQPTNRERWERNLRAKYPDVQDEDELYGRAMDSYDTEHDYAKQSREEARQLADIINQNPEVAKFYSDLSQGNVGAAFLNLGDLLKAYMSGEIDDEGYKNGLAERQKAEDAKKAAEDDRNSKIAAQDEVFKQWCEKKGYDPEEWMKRASEQLFTPMSSYAMAEAQFDAVDKMLNYDDDIEVARAQERNKKIVAERKKNAAASDGQLNRGSAAANTAPKKKMNIFDYAEAAQ